MRYLYKAYPDYKFVCLIRRKGRNNVWDRFPEFFKGQDTAIDKTRFELIDFDKVLEKELFIQDVIRKHQISKAFLFACDMRHFVDYSVSRVFNIEFQILLLKILKQCRIRINYFSSLAIFGFNGGNFKESYQLNKIEPDFSYGYGSSKLALEIIINQNFETCLLYTSPSPRDRQKSRMPSSA